MENNLNDTNLIREATENHTIVVVHDGQSVKSLEPYGLGIAPGGNSIFFGFVRYVYGTVACANGWHVFKLSEMVFVRGTEMKFVPHEFPGHLFPGYQKE
jgi:hypothetical protein